MFGFCKKYTHVLTALYREYMRILYIAEARNAHCLRSRTPLKIAVVFSCEQDNIALPFYQVIETLMERPQGWHSQGFRMEIFSALFAEKILSVP